MESCKLKKIYTVTEITEYVTVAKAVFDEEVTKEKKPRKKAVRAETVRIAGVEYGSISYLQKKGVVQGLGPKGIEALLASEGVDPINVGRRKLYNIQKMEQALNPAQGYSDI